MNRKLAILVVVVLLLGGIGVGAYALRGEDSSSATISPAGTKSSAATETPGTKKAIPVTISGKMICLTPKDTSGPVKNSCAFGLAGDDGKNYALNVDDPLSASAPTGQQVKVTGSFTEALSEYDSVGIIKVELFERQ